MIPDDGTFSGFVNIHALLNKPEGDETTLIPNSSGKAEKYPE